MGNTIAPMNLKTWADQQRGRGITLAKHLQVPPSFVSKMLNGTKAIPAEHCRAIHTLTGGEVTLPEMRPADWQKYWPELADASPQAQATQAAQGQGA